MLFCFFFFTSLAEAQLSVDGQSGRASSLDSSRGDVGSAGKASVELGVVGDELNALGLQAAVVVGVASVLVVLAISGAASGIQALVVLVTARVEDLDLGVEEALADAAVWPVEEIFTHGAVVADLLEAGGGAWVLHVGLWVEVALWVEQGGDSVVNLASS